jgi:hypothetical protein
MCYYEENKKRTNVPCGPCALRRRRQGEKVLSVLFLQNLVAEAEQQSAVCKKQDEGVLRGFPTLTRKPGESRLAANQSPAHRAGSRETLS